LRDAGAEVVVAGGSTSADRIASALSDLGRRGITSLFLEGGRTLASAFSDTDQLDEARLFIAPVLLGAQDEGGRRAGPVAAGDPPPPAVARASSGVGPPTAPPARVHALSTSHERVGEDHLIIARFKEW
jgi:hypothetical protein